jgi:hypothetical protein
MIQTRAGENLALAGQVQEAFLEEVGDHGAEDGVYDKVEKVPMCVDIIGESTVTCNESAVATRRRGETTKQARRKRCEAVGGSKRWAKQWAK